MFDQLGWSWHYEPIDLAGYIPDFIIEGANTNVLVEVKPIFTLDGELADQVLSACGYKDDIFSLDYVPLICGAVLPINEFSVPGLGWLWDGGWLPSQVFHLLESEGYAPNQYGLCHTEQSYHDRISGINRGDAHVDEHADLSSMWKIAGNAVQWMPK